MSARLTEEDVALLNEPQIGIVATVNADGTPQLTPVWVDTDGEAVLFNTSQSRVKFRNLNANPSIGIAVVDKENAFRWVSIQGTAELIEEGADDHVDRLAKKYLGKDKYPWGQPGDKRITVRVAPTRRISG